MASKRAAEGERSGFSDNFASTTDQPDDRPQKATAAQLAKRNIAQLKKGAARNRAPLRNTQQLPAAQTFGGTSSQQQQHNPFNFGSQSQSFGGTSQASNAGQSQSQSASFPLFSSIAPPNTSFNFESASSTPVNNPFATSMNNFQNSTASGLNGGFQGSIFNIPPPSSGVADGSEASKSSQKHQEDQDNPPLWANGINPFSNLPESRNGALEQQQLSQPLAEGSSKDAPAQTPQPSGLFGQSAGALSATQQQQSPFKLNFGNTQSSQPTSNIFGSSNSSNMSPALPSTQSTSNIFGSLMTQPSTTSTFKNTQSDQSKLGQFGSTSSTEQSGPNLFNSAPSNAFGTQQPQRSVFNPFGNTQSDPFRKTRSEQTESIHKTSDKSDSAGANGSTSNIFGNSQQVQKPQSSRIFGQLDNSRDKGQEPTSPTQDDGDRMSTTPATSPAGVQQPATNALASITPPAPPKLQGTTGGLFGRISKPVETSATADSDKDVNLHPNAQATGLFNAVLKPDEAGQQGNKEGLNSPISAFEASNNKFTGFGRPIADTTSSKSKQPGSAESEAPKNLFAGIMQSSTDMAQGSNDQVSPDLGNGSLKSRFPGFGQRSAKASMSGENKTTSDPVQQADKTSDQDQVKPVPPPNMFTEIKQPPASSLFAPSQSPRTPIVSESVETSTDKPVIHSNVHHSFSKPVGRLPGAPPKSLLDFQEVDKQQSVTGYRLKAFDAGYKKHFRFNAIEDLLATVTYYQNRREAIVAAGDYPIVDAAGSKRKTPPLEINDASPFKKARFEPSAEQPSSVSAGDTGPSTVTGASLNGTGSVPTLFSQPDATKQLSPAKRNAEEFLAVDDARGASDSAKESRNQTPATFSSFSTSQGSHTSNIFKSIVDHAADESQSAPSTQTQGSQFSATPTKAPTANMSSPVKPSATPFKLNATAVSANLPAETRSTSTTETPKIKPPTFGTGAPTNFMSQFQQLSKKEEQEKKRKLKEQDLDSDDDEADWERRYEEEQRAKKQKIEGAAKGMKYVLGKGFVSSNGDLDDINSRDLDQNDESSAPISRASSVSVLDQPLKPMTNGMTNIFGHISPPGSGAEGSKTGDADDEDTASEESRGEEEDTNTSYDHIENNHDSQSSTTNNVFSAFSAMTTPKAVSQAEDEQPISRSLFDRMEKDKDGNLVRETPSAQEKKAGSLFNFALSGNNGNDSSKTVSSSPFPTLSTSTPTSQQTTKEPSGSSASSGDHTWKADSPIRFGKNNVQPEVRITSATPPKPTLAQLFGNQPKAESSHTPSKPLFNFSQTTSLKTPDVGFGISIARSNGSLAPSDADSNNVSRATSPGLSSNAETISESGGEDGEEQQQQIDLTSGGPGEEDEEVLFQVKAKALEFDAAKKGWLTRGVGPIRVLKHNESGKTRLLMRQDPSGRIILNAALLGGVTYKHSSSRPKAVEVPFATDSGRLASYVIRLGKDTDAVELASILEKNKTA